MSGASDGASFMPSPTINHFAAAALQLLDPRDLVGGRRAGAPLCDVEHPCGGTYRRLTITRQDFDRDVALLERGDDRPRVGPQPLPHREQIFIAAPG